jgi:predicted DCC family thiol-disulfide oxidoreductase YuxK
MKVIFFDGYCGLCNGFIDFVMKIDKKGVFKFSPLQSEFAKAHLKPEDIEQLKSVVVLIDGNTFRKAPGVMKVFKELNGMWKAFSALGILPSGFLNFGYDLVAENRYRLFGKRETCRLPTPEERTRFIL